MLFLPSGMIPGCSTADCSDDSVENNVGGTAARSVADWDAWKVLEYVKTYRKFRCLQFGVSQLVGGERGVEEVGVGGREVWFCSAVLWASHSACSGTDTLKVGELPLTGSLTGKNPHLLRSWFFHWLKRNFRFPICEIGPLGNISTVLQDNV